MPNQLSHPGTPELPGRFLKIVMMRFFFLSSFIHSFIHFYERERAHAHTSGGGAENEREREKIPSRLPTVRAEPDVMLELTDYEIMT